MSNSNYVQNSFLGGEWSPTAQGRFDTPGYRSGMNVNRNALMTSEGSWTRRSGTRHCGTSYLGKQGRVISFDFENDTPYILELTDQAMRFRSVSSQVQGLRNPLPNDIRLATTNDNVVVTNISTANPAVITTATPNIWTTGDEVEFLFEQTSRQTPLLRNRTFIATVLTTTTFSISDPITGLPIDGNTLGWTGTEQIVVSRILRLQTPYPVNVLNDIRSIQAEKQSIMLHGSYKPYVLSVNQLPSTGNFATFSMNAANFKDGPYLDPPSDGTVILPTQNPATQGTLPSVAYWDAIASDGAGHFVAIASASNKAAYSSDHGATWTASTLPATAFWVSIAYGGGKFVAIAQGGTYAAYSTDNGATWTASTLPIFANWQAIAWNGTVFCAVAKSTSNTIYFGSSGFVASTYVTYAVPGTSSIATSADGITWTLRSNPSMPYALPILAIGAEGIEFTSVTSFNGLLVATTENPAWSSDANGSKTITGTAILYTSSDNGVTWIQNTLPINAVWTDIVSSGALLVAIATGSNSIVTSANGTSWVQRALPVSTTWQSIAYGGGLFCAVARGTNIAATSPDGIAWTQQALPYTYNWYSIAWDGTNFCTPAYGTSISISSSFGTFLSTTLAFTSVASINDGQGFLTTDVGRHIRLLSEPLAYNAGTAYVVDNTVKFNGVYYRCIQAGTGKQPDSYPTYWAISPAAATWTWAIITSIIEFDDIRVAIQGPNLLSSTNQINTWRLGVYSDTTGYPTCGCYHEGRLVLGGAVANRFDASVSADIFNFAPTAYDGTVADSNAIDYTFNSREVNPIYWMLSTSTGIIAGTQEGEWLIQASSLSTPLTPTSIQAHLVTTYGGEKIEAVHTELTIAFVQRFARKLLECFQDVFSSRVSAQNLAQNAKHLMESQLKEVRYQQELSPIVWARMGDGSLNGVTYQRKSLYSSQPADMAGWHRHDLGSGRTIESITVGSSVDGTLDALSMMTNDANSGIRHVEIMQNMPQVGDTIQTGWYIDNGIVPSFGVISNKQLTLYGLWHLNGGNADIVIGGVDCGSISVTSGAAVVNIDVNFNDLLTTPYLRSISSQTAYGTMTVPVFDGQNIYYIPAVAGYTYTSQGQLLRPDTLEDTRSPTGVGLGKPRRTHQFGVNMYKTQGISFGGDLSNLRPANFTDKAERPYTNLQLFSGIYWDTMDDDYSFDGMVAWQISRPYPATILSITGYMNTQDR